MRVIQLEAELKSKSDILKSPWEIETKQLARTSKARTCLFQSADWIGLEVRRDSQTTATPTVLQTEPEGNRLLVEEVVVECSDTTCNCSVAEGMGGREDEEHGRVFEVRNHQDYVSWISLV